MAVVHLGGGRLKGGDIVHPAVGLSNIALIGDYMGRGELVATIHARNLEDADRAEAEIRAALDFSADAPQEPPLIYERVGP